jgi:REP element-mobilizing transposase RayT
VTIISGALSKNEVHMVVKMSQQVSVSDFVRRAKGRYPEPDSKVVERYQYVVIQPSLGRGRMDHDMDWDLSGGR